MRDGEGEREKEREREGLDVAKNLWACETMSAAYLSFGQVAAVSCWLTAIRCGGCSALRAVINIASKFQTILVQ